MGGGGLNLSTFFKNYFHSQNIFRGVLAFGLRDTKPVDTPKFGYIFPCKKNCSQKITFSIVFTTKKALGWIESTPPPPPLKYKGKKHTIKIMVNPLFKPSKVQITGPK